MSDIKKIKDEFLLRLNENLDLNQINEIKSDLFGKNGLVSSQFKKLGSITESERKIFASDLNTVKEELQNKIIQKIQEIKTKEINQKFNPIQSKKERQLDPFLKNMELRLKKLIREIKTILAFH